MRLRLVALAFALVQTGIHPGDNVAVSWLTVGALAVAAFGSAGLLRGAPTPSRVARVGWAGMALDTGLVAAVMFNNLTDPSDVIWVAVVLPLIEAATRWASRGGAIGGVFFGALTAAWSIAVAAAVGVPVVAEYLSLKAGVIAILGGFLGVLVSELASERRALQQVLRLSRDLMLTVDPRGNVVAVNEASRTILGVEPSQIIGRRLDDFVVATPVTTGAGDRMPAAALGVPLDNEAMLERAFRVSDGSAIWLELGVTPDPDFDLVYIVGRDVTEKRAHAAALVHQAFHDPLTGVANRMRLMEQVAERLAERTRNLALLFVDLDRFKMVNDTLGHAGGDELLRAVVGRIRGAVRGRDLVARFAGDEFCVLLPDVSSSAEAVEVAERIVAALAAPYEIDGTDAVVSASVGVALAAPLDTAETLLHHADQAMYRAKQLGRNRAVLHDTSDRVFGAHVADSLVGAIARDELCLHYQPIYDIGSGRIVTLEALVRWRHPDEGLLDPHTFLRAAEDAGLAVALGEWVLETAVAQFAAWASAGLVGGMELSVNLSAVELCQAEIVDTLLEVVARHSMGPGSLVVDVAESAVLADPTRLTPLLAKIADAGVKVAIDDFGTGYSSHRQLRSVPADYLKIDRSFVSSMVSGSPDEAIVRSAVRLARSLGVPVVAEGVETAEQLRLLGEIGCSRAQGYLLGPPADPAETGRRLWQEQSAPPPNEP